MKTDDELTATERDKYQRIWAHPEYNANGKSPGLRIAPTARIRLRMKVGGTLLDFGCGRSQAVDWFRAHGIDAVGIDIHPQRADVIEAPIWDIGDKIDRADYGFSCDVLEHLPPERVDAALGEIARLTRIGAYLCVCTRPDLGGALIGETLHLTVEPREWWEERLARHFAMVDFVPVDRHDTAHADFLCRHVG